MEKDLQSQSQQQPLQQPTKKKSRTWIWVTFIVVAIMVGYIAMLSLFFSPFIGGSDLDIGANSIAMIGISGVIAESDMGGVIFGAASGASPIPIIKQLKMADENPDIKAIILRVNSPGGTPAAAQEIYTAVKRTKKPVVVSIADVCASGAYYVSSAADEIIASPASEVGSIGVIIEIPNYAELLKKVGIENVVIAQGKYKDLGNPARPLTEEEKTILKEHTEIIYDQFIKDVADGRDLKYDKVKEMATGLTYPGSEAVKMGLVDKLGGYQDAVKTAAKLGKIKGEPNVVNLSETSFFDLFYGVNQLKSIIGVLKALALSDGLVNGDLGTVGEAGSGTAPNYSVK